MSASVDFATAVAAVREVAADELAVPDPEQVRALLVGAARLYSRLDELGEPVGPIDGTQVTATEAVTVAAALMRAQQLNPFDLQLWLDRTPHGEEGGR